MKNVSKNTGLAIRNLRISLGFSQEKLAELSGLHRTYISDIERGSRNVTLISLSKIADALQIPLSGLIRKAEYYEQYPKNR